MRTKEQPQQPLMESRLSLFAAPDVPGQHHLYVEIPSVDCPRDPARSSEGMNCSESAAPIHLPSCLFSSRPLWTRSGLRSVWYEKMCGGGARFSTVEMQIGPASARASGDLPCQPVSGLTGRDQRREKRRLRRPKLGDDWAGLGVVSCLAKEDSSQHGDSTYVTSAAGRSSC